MDLKKPAFIMFDYGQTLIKEGDYNGAAGFDHILQYASANPSHVTGETLQREMEAINAELGRFNPAIRHLRLTEMPEESIFRWLFDRYGVEFPAGTDLRSLEFPFWNAANPCEACEGIGEVLTFLKSEHIGTGVVSNLSFRGETLRERICRAIPEADFAFVISSCDYLFRKPSRHIFEAALARAGVPADEVWFCGDQFVPDIQGSSDVGMTPVWYKAHLRYDRECEMTRGVELNNWHELIDLIRSLD